jgi:PAS domain-containing protein
LTLPTVILNADGTTADANAAALEMLGVTLDVLKSLPPGALSPDPPDPVGEAAFRKEWEAEGQPDIGGQATVKRVDGSQVRVKFGITPLEDGRFLAVMEPVDAPLDTAPVVYTAGQVLAEWRAAERRLTEIPEGSAEWRAIHRDIDLFRKRYQEKFQR